MFSIKQNYIRLSKDMTKKISFEIYLCMIPCFKSKFLYLIYHLLKLYSTYIILGKHKHMKSSSVAAKTLLFPWKNYKRIHKKMRTQIIKRFKSQMLKFQVNQEQSI